MRASVWSVFFALAASSGLGLASPVAASTQTAVSASAAHQVAALRGLVVQVASEHGLDPRLVDALVRVESAYNPRAVSRKGAMGLMQLMPATARRLSVANPFEPEQNIRGGVRELARLIDRFAGDLALALAAYNAGEGAVERHGGIPPYRETREYVRRIMGLYEGRDFDPSVLRRRAAVRLVRDDSNGGVVITNVGAGAAGPAPAARIGGRALGGGFGR